MAKSLCLSPKKPPLVRQLFERPLSRNLVGLEADPAPELLVLHVVRLP